MGWFGAHRTRTWFHGSANAPKLSAMGSSSTLLRREGARTWSSHTDAGIRPFRFALWSNERTRTTDLLITSDHSGVAGVCRGLQMPHYLEAFPFPALLRVAPYCVPGGIRVVSIQVHICFTMRLARGTHAKYV